MTPDRLPSPLRRVHEAVTDEASRLGAAKSRLFQPFERLSPIDSLASISRAIELLSDDRSMLTAYFHAISNPRPHMGAIAVAQDVSLSTLRHRYTSEQAIAVQMLIDKNPIFDLILEPFASFGDHFLLHAADDADYSEIWEKRYELRLAYFAFADQMESPGRSYDNLDLRDLCFRYGLSYRSARKLIESSDGTGLQQTMESLKLTPPTKLPQEHPGHYRRLISEYPRGGMLTALEQHPSHMKDFYLEQISHVAD